MDKSLIDISTTLAPRVFAKAAAESAIPLTELSAQVRFGKLKLMQRRVGILQEKSAPIHHASLVVAVVGNR